MIKEKRSVKRSYIVGSILLTKCFSITHFNYINHVVKCLILYAIHWQGMRCDVGAPGGDGTSGSAGTDGNKGAKGVAGSEGLQGAAVSTAFI